MRLDTFSCRALAGSILGYKKKFKKGINTAFKYKDKRPLAKKKDFIKAYKYKDKEPLSIKIKKAYLFVLFFWFIQTVNAHPSSCISDHTSA